ncbi:MAG: carbonic anhydrase [Acidobacteria bacterium]|nr:carbonic anhydrase [Acidobacteriota bacterium]
MDRLTADEAYERLKQGNLRFLSGAVEGAGRDAERREMVASGQRPFAVILCCADSRVVPELAFDTGIGELFVVRVAGNVANKATVASIEFAISQLGPKLLVVMAHGGCGAVTAAMGDGAPSPSLEHLLSYIRPAVDTAGTTDIDEVSRHNAMLNAQRLSDDSQIIESAIAEGGVRVVTAFYHPGTGSVDLLWTSI